MKDARQISHNSALPLLLRVPLLWAMAGCFYFPTFEHPTLAFFSDLSQDRLTQPSAI